MILSNLYRIIKKNQYTYLFVLCIAALLVLSMQNYFNQPSVAHAASEAPPKKIFLPLAQKPDPLLGGNLPLMLGTYIDGWLAEQDDIDIQVHQLNNWASEVGGAPLSIVGTFVDIETPNYKNYVTAQLLTAWDNGYTPFVNLETNLAAYQIARGDVDEQLRSWAKAYAAYSQNGERIAFIAPLAEMNGRWVPYGLDPVNYKLAFQHIQQIFKQEGVSQGDVIWTFAPNGWNKPGDPPFEAYYPGDAIVDVVGFSGYNFGGCSSGTWESPQEVYGPYIQRMVLMAPLKPIFITQTGSSSFNGDKERWLQDAYNYLKAKTSNNLRGILYFNKDSKYDSKCDWAFYKTWGTNQRIYDIYRVTVTEPIYDYADPETILNTFR